MNLYLATCLSTAGPQCRTVLARDRKSAFIRAVKHCPGRVTHLFKVGPATLANFRRNQLHWTLDKAEACEFLANTLIEINNERRLILSHVICNFEESIAHIAKAMKQ